MIQQGNKRVMTVGIGVVITLGVVALFKMKNIRPHLWWPKEEGPKSQCEEGEEQPREVRGLTEQYRESGCPLGDCCHRDKGVP